MSLKLKAFLQLVCLVAAGVAGAELLNFIATYVPKETIWTAIQVGLIGGLLYLCYTVILARLEYNEKLKDLSKSIKG